MGSFNVACSISNLSLSAGTKVVFYPLLPKHFGRGETMLESGKYLLYQNCYYEPFSLPIKGVYNDYGSIGDIEEDDNTKAIEAFFGISIEKFVRQIGRECPEGIEGDGKAVIYENLSGMFVHRAIFEELVAFDLKDSHLANDYLVEEIANFYDFQVVPSEEQLLIDSHHPILMRKEGLPYDLKIGAYGAVLLHQRHKEYYAFAFDKRYGQEIAQNWERITKTKIDEVFSPDIDFHRLTDEQYRLVKEKFTELTGAPLGRSPKSADKYSVYSVIDFAKAYENVTGEALDIEVWATISQYDRQYTKFQETLRKQRPVKKLDYAEVLARTTNEMEQKMLRQLIKLDAKKTVDNDFGYEANQLPFGRFFKEMDYFKALYYPILLRGGLRHALKEHQAFTHSMYACNRFFFPAMNGEQFGNPTASKMLLDASIDIVKKQLTELEE